MSVRWRWLGAAVVVLAALLRTWQLGAIPPGFQFDEAHNAIDAVRWLEGIRIPFLPDNGGREVLLTWLHVPLLAGLGRDHPVLAMRLVSAFVGTVTVALTGVVSTRLTGDRRVGWLAAGLLATSYWHLHFSRYGIRAILAPLWILGASYTWWRATTSAALEGPATESIERADPPATTRSGSPRTTDPRAAARHGGRDPWWWWAIGCGACLAGGVWSHPSGRLLPLILVLHAAWRLVHKPASWRRSARALAVAGAVSALLFAPLGWFFVEHPWLFTSHASDVSLAAVAERRYDGDIVRALISNATAILGMFFLSGDPSTFHNLPDLPVFDPLSGLWFVLGVGLVLAWAAGRSGARERDVAGLLAAWLLVGLLPTLLSDRPPNYSRAMAALPALVMLPALGVRWASATWSRGRGRDPWPLVALVTIGVSTAWTVGHYFVRFPRLDHLPYSYDVEKLEVLADLDRAADGASIFLAPVWATHATVQYTTQVAAPAAVADDPTLGGDPFEDRDAGDAAGDAAPRDGTPPTVRGLDFRRTLWWPAGGRDVLLAWPVGEAEELDVSDEVNRLAAGLAEGPGTPRGPTARIVDGSIGSSVPPPPHRRNDIIRDVVADRRGEPQVVAFRLRAGLVGDMAAPRDAPLEPAEFVGRTYAGGALAGRIELVGYSAGVARSGEPLPITLVWRAIAPPERNLTTFVHLEGPDGQGWGQEDREPGRASARTSTWGTGDVIIDRFEPALSDDAAVEVRPVVGWYDLDSGERMTVDGQDAVRLAPLPVVDPADR